MKKKARILNTIMTHRAVNFRTDENGDLVCPNNKKFHYCLQQTYKGRNKYGRTEEFISVKNVAKLFS